MAEVRMPKMGDGMEEGTLLRWLKHEGDSVAVNESIAEIETDKANVEMPAEESGTLTKIIVQEGETVPVGAVLAHIGDVSGNGKGANAAKSNREDSGRAVSGEAPPSAYPQTPKDSEAQPESPR